MSRTKDAWQEQQEMEQAHQAYEQQQAEREEQTPAEEFSSHLFDMMVVMNQARREEML